MTKLEINYFLTKLKDEDFVYIIVRAVPSEY